MPEIAIGWREYHEATKHSVESLKRARRKLDWANMPDPFRHYEGVPVLDLPADPPDPEFGTASDGPTFLSQLLFHSAAISASKVVPSTGRRYALRVNPSSGNLHPTEFHFFTRGLDGWPDGLYHYRPSSHMAEQRAVGRFDVDSIPSAPIVFVLTSIVWREAWKYQDRAYRYCLHDIGHAWQALALAAGAMGCETFANGRFSDDGLSRLLGLSEDEWPMLIVSLRGSVIPMRETVDAQPEQFYGGEANRLSPHSTPYPLIDAIHSATKLSDIEAGQLPPSRYGRSLSASIRPFGEVARTRRSALDFEGGSKSMSQEQLSLILASATQPFYADFAESRFIQLYLYVHRVDGLEPGVYRHSSETGELRRIKAGDQRVMAAALSLAQDLAGNACVAFSMIADLEKATRANGQRGYRYAHFEAGAIGQRLYLAAESVGLRATGIGAFYDDRVNEYLDLTPAQGQVVYHFAIGYPIPDFRLEAC